MCLLSHTVCCPVTGSSLSTEKQTNNCRRRRAQRRILLASCHRVEGVQSSSGVKPREHCARSGGLCCSTRLPGMYMYNPIWRHGARGAEAAGGGRQRASRRRAAVHSTTNTGWKQRPAQPHHRLSEPCGTVGGGSCKKRSTELKNRITKFCNILWYFENPPNTCQSFKVFTQNQRAK